MKRALLAILTLLVLIPTTSGCVYTLGKDAKSGNTTLDVAWPETAFLWFGLIGLYYMHDDGKERNYYNYRYDKRNIHVHNNGCGCKR
jgi:hypothetical protein